MDYLECDGSSSSSSSLITKKLKPNEDAFNNGLGVSGGMKKEVDDAELIKSTITSGSIPSTSDPSNCSPSYHDDADDPYDDDDDYIDEDEADSDDNYEYLYEDDYLKMQAQFDHVDLPPGVEASVPWLAKPTLSEKSTDASSSKAADSSASGGKDEIMMDDVLRKLMYFKHFDVVEDFSDHHYRDKGYIAREPPKSWAKKVQDEWKILEENLPETIYVRVYETRMDLLRAAIIGPAGTPYHDGLFFFDAMFPSTYPNDPPLVYYHSGGLRLNPNLYHCGKVCLSLLGTWTGRKNEMWLPDRSTMLQVLVSIQALILNAKPFFNEPGYDKYQGEEGIRKSNKYNEDTFILSLRTMTYSLRNPPKHFADLVAGHFRINATDILTACQVYSKGAEVGSNFWKIVKEGEEIKDNNSKEFKNSIAQIMPTIIAALLKNGSNDIDKFLTN